MGLNKKNISTIIVILSSCILSLGGFFMIQELLERRENVILSMTGCCPIITADRGESEKGEMDHISGFALSQEELRYVLKSMETVAADHLHEPYGQQISMKDAIETGKSWLKDFFGNFIGKEDKMKEYNKITAALHDKGPTIDDPAIPDELYSYWKIEYMTDEAEISLFLNAVTGQVLQAKVKLTDSELFPINAEELLRAYGETFSLELDADIREDHDLKYFSTENGIFVIFSESAFAISEQSETEIVKHNIVWNLYLSTELR